MSSVSPRSLKRAGTNQHGKSEYNKHGDNTVYIPGDHWNECQRCGFDVRESNSKMEWTGLIVCEGCYDPRQPQDFVRGMQDDTSPKGLVRPEAAVDGTAWDGQSTRTHTDISGSNTVNVDGSTDAPSGTFSDSPL